MKKLILFLCLLSGISSCGIYNFTGGSTGNAKTFQVNFFQNRAPLIEPGMDREFTFYLQDLINNQTNLSLTNSNGDLVYEGEITNFTVAPMAATADQRAAQNRLTVTVNVRFTNNKEEDKDFEKQFSHYYDFPANAQLSSVKSAAFEAIFERIGQDIFNASLANW
ncbi:LptE family protein [Capnocytophaga gingivalis]|uniref:LptE family protein n=1 Tax=Capnocytophaga gingivalis TaxID=1017 RepID=UPI0028E4F16E|nr:LptE family protein [Capnocytophaga gingivalis]